MNIQEIIAALNEEWEYETGFFAKLRDLEFDEKRGQRVIDILREIPKDMESYPRDLVAHFWYMPLTLEWNYENFAKAKNVNVDLLKYAQCKNEVTKLLGEIIGGP